MKKNFYVLISIFLIYFSCYSQKFSENDMKVLAKDMVTIQVRTYYFKLLNSSANNIPDKYDFSRYYLVFLNFNLYNKVNLDDVIKFNDFYKYEKKFKVFKIYCDGMKTWYFIAFGDDGSYYLLRNFEYNHINNLIRQKIGRPKTINEYLDIGKLYINTVQFSDYGFRKVISASEYHNLKKKHDSIAPPKLYKYKDDTILEFYSLQSSTNKVKHHKLIFKDGLIKNVEETPDDG